jgi:hypothetical protein
MALLNPDRNSALVVFGLKQRPPINFNVTLQAHALQHGLTVNRVGVHTHPTGNSISIHLSGMNIERSRQFAESAKGRYYAYIHSATVRVGNNAFKV